MGLGELKPKPRDPSASPASKKIKGLPISKGINVSPFNGTDPRGNKGVGI